MNAEDLLRQARLARDSAYAPYSHFAVGAALLAGSGRTYTGCNIENASYGATICAERVAAAKAVSAGEREFVALAVVADGPIPPAPCGLCCQFLAEFGRDLAIYTSKSAGDADRLLLRDLLPMAFTRRNMPDCD